MVEYKLLWDHFEQLQDDDDAHRRGRGLELLVAEVFRRNHFSIVHNAGIARPRQTDFYASLGSERYLVEVKWTTKPTDMATIASVRDRLSRTAPDVMGLIVSISGFTGTAITEVGTYRHTAPLLLINGEELEELLWYWSRLRSLLKAKLQDLVAHGIVRTTLPERRIWVTEPALGLPPPTIVTYDNHITQLPLTYRTSGGPHCVFVQTLPLGTDEHSSNGVDLELQLAPKTAEELVRTLHTLQQTGWTGGEGCWSILNATTEQTTTGFGVETLVTELHRVGQPGSEPVSYAYFDNPSDDDFYTLSGTLDTDPRHSPQWESRLSFRLKGIPLDLEPFRDLAHALDALRPPVFEPRAAPRVVGTSCEESKQPLLTLVAGLSESRGGLDPECTGAVFNNPYFHELDTPADVPVDTWKSLASSEFLISRLYIPFDPATPPGSFQLLGADVSNIGGLEVWRIFVWAED